MLYNIAMTIITHCYVLVIAYPTRCSQTTISADLDPHISVGLYIEYHERIAVK